MTDEAKDRTELWLPLLRRLTDQFPQWAVLKNADSAFRGTGDLDSLAPKSDWAGIQEAFIEWAEDHGLGTVVVCTHAPGGPKFVSFQEDSPYIIQLDVMDRRIFRGSPFIETKQLLELAEIDPRGFRRIRPGAEGVMKLFLNGVNPGGRMNIHGLRTKQVIELLQVDPEGVHAAADLFGPVRNSVLAAVDAVLAGSWSQRAIITVELWALLRGLKHPLATYRLFRYRKGGSWCAIKRLNDRRVPEDIRTWLQRDVAPTHKIHLLRPYHG
jgi:hypothetical protein